LAEDFFFLVFLDFASLSVALSALFSALVFLAVFLVFFAPASSA